MKDSGETIDKESGEHEGRMDENEDSRNEGFEDVDHCDSDVDDDDNNVDDEPQDDENRESQSLSTTHHTRLFALHFRIGVIDEYSQIVFPCALLTAFMKAKICW